jgi:hypothetical protein
MGIVLTKVVEIKVGTKVVVEVEIEVEIKVGTKVVVEVEIEVEIKVVDIVV